jgi:hypothetical protein
MTDSRLPRRYIRLERLCVCGVSLEGHHSYARWCSKRCYDEARRGPSRQARILAAVLRRPRCVICDGPIRYGQPGIRYSDTTCGDRVCVVRRNHWYGPAGTRARRQLSHREVSRHWMRAYREPKP